MENYNSLSFLVVIPLILGLLSLIAPKGLQRAYAVVGSLALLLITFFQGASVLFATTATQVIEQKIEWLPAFGASISLRFDSVSAWFVLMNAVVAVIAFSVNGSWYRKFPRLFSFLGFSLVAFLNGAFLSTDLIVFYLFYEAVFIPMIFMVGIWGQESKATAVFRFFLMSLAGSVLMLVSIFYLIALHHEKTGGYSSNIMELILTAKQNPAVGALCFSAFFLAFAIKVPLVPFHGWLKEVYTLAPMPATIWLSASLSKLGVYGLIRFVLPLFTDVMIPYQGALLCLAAVSIVYSAFLAIRASDPKTLLAYSSISHLGFVLIGVFSLKSEGVSSAVLLCIGHTLVSSMLFYILYLVEERVGKTSLDKNYGLAKRYPILFFLMFVSVLAGVSLPGTVNFVGEFLVLLSGFPGSPGAVVIAGLGVVLGAVYLLKFYQNLALGKPTENLAPALQKTEDIGFFDFTLVSLVLIFVIILGFQPIWILKGN